MDQFQAREKELQEYLERVNRTIITTKDKKLLWDRKAFKNKKAYRWSSGPPRRPPYREQEQRVPNAQNKVDGSISDSSLSSHSSYASLPPARNSNQKQNKKQTQEEIAVNKTQASKRRPENTTGDLETEVMSNIDSIRHTTNPPKTPTHTYLAQGAIPEPHRAIPTALF